MATNTNFYSEQKTRSNIQQFYTKIDMPGGYGFDHVETLKTIDLYYNSKYKTGEYDSLGFRKFFYNIVKPACDIATKFIDLDTKDIILIPEHNDDEFKIFIMNRMLKQWLKNEEFDEILNEISFDLPKYGSVVLKKCKKGFEKVNLHNLRFQTWAEELECSEFVYELLSMNKTEIAKMKWDSDAVEQLYSRDKNANQFVIYECYEMTVDGWHKVIYGDLFSTKTKNGINRSVESEINEQDNYFGSICLYEEDVKELPYRELHWEKVPGRWLGYGFVEYLSENQIAINEAENLERKGLHFTSLKLYQTRDESIGGQNLLSGSQNGDILYIQSEITPIAMEERNLGAFNNTRSNWSANTERKTFTSDITTGASLPSRTPLGVANLQASLASSFFDLKRENIGIFIKELILEDVLPDFKKANRKEVTMTLLGTDSEVDLYDNYIAKIYLDEAVVNYVEKNGFFPSQEEKDLTKKKLLDEIKQQKNRYITLPDNVWDDARYSVDVIITGESVDTGAKSQLIQFVLQIVGTNPAVMQSPQTKKMIFALLSLGGVSPAEIGLLDEQQATQENPQQQQVAGSLAKPTPVSGITPNTQIA